jgi:outer membrane murein-binding lipoprotein Lpp
MKVSLIAITLAMLASPALACTAEEAQSKAMELSTKMQELAAKDPQKAGDVGQKLAAAQGQAVTDLDGACKLYDDMLVEFE